MLVMVSCTVFIPKETRYLESAQGRATQDEVRQELGPPQFTETQAGTTIWVYQVRQQEPGGRTVVTGAWCDEYVLAFDGREVLQRWTHSSYFHGGENMPTYCVPGGFKPSS
jgi:outer membrane protein assembly factor BamE (lipoprotein component of BamABCDE complex)